MSTRARLLRAGWNLGYRRGHMTTSGTMLGERYRLDGLIGRGGMATVWRAYDTVLDRDVAIKRLHTRLHGDRELEERFRREGQMVANLSHPNLVRLLDQGGEDAEPFLVFELVDGQDLKTILRQHGRMAPERAAAIGAQIARALAVAHREGIVHRDIKSHNVLVTPDGTAKLTDFGIARIVDVEGDLTRTGIVIGSSDYLSPEQAEGKTLDGRSDLYSLGVVVFEALTGRLPFSGENPVAVATKHVYEAPPDPRDVVPEIPDSLAVACLRALEKSPRDRFPTGDTFANALLGTAAEPSQPAADLSETTSRLRAVRGRATGRRRAAAIVGLVVAAGAIGGAVVYGPDALRRVTPGSTSTPGSSVALPFTAVDDDPLGDNREHPDEVGRIADADAATEWSSETYRAATATFGKAGVGLKLTLDAPHRLIRVVLTTTSPGAVAQILGSGEAGDARTPISAQTTLVEGANTIPITTEAPQQQIVVWFTTPGTTALTDGGYRVSVGQVVVEGAANS